MSRSTLLLIIIGVIMTATGLVLDVLVWLHLVAKTEPQLVLHLSTAALYFSGFGTLVTAIVNKNVKKG